MDRNTRLSYISATGFLLMLSTSAILSYGVNHKFISIIMGGFLLLGLILFLGSAIALTTRNKFYIPTKFIR